MVFKIWLKIRKFQFSGNCIFVTFFIKKKSLQSFFYILRELSILGENISSDGQNYCSKGSKWGIVCLCSSNTFGDTTKFMTMWVFLFLLFCIKMLTSLYKNAINAKIWKSDTFYLNVPQPPKATGVGAAVFSKILDAKMMYTPPKLNPPSPIFFRRPLCRVYVWTQKWCTLPQNWIPHLRYFFADHYVECMCGHKNDVRSPKI